MFESDNIRLSAYRVLYRSDNLYVLRDVLLHLRETMTIKRVFDDEEAIGACGIHIEQCFRILNSSIESCFGSYADACGK